VRGQRAIDVARRASQGLTGTITVGFVGSVSYALLPRILLDFRTHFPSIHIDLRELTSTEQIENLRAHRIDLGIVRLPLNNAADMELSTIATERLIAVLPQDHRLAGAKTLRLKDLADDAFMIFPGDKIPSLHAKFLLACEKAGFSPRIVLEAWQMASMVSLVAARMGVALLPAQVSSSPHPGVVYKDLSDQSEHLELKVAAAWRPGVVSGAVRSMLSILTYEKERSAGRP
jgi:DNA-binding transcriptional LysR family regulator